MSHIIGRPDDGLLDIMLGRNTDPERAIIDGSEQAQEAGEGAEEPAGDDEPTTPA